LWFHYETKKVLDLLQEHRDKTRNYPYKITIRRDIHHRALLWFQKITVSQINTILRYSNQGYSDSSELPGAKFCV